VSRAFWQFTLKGDLNAIRRDISAYSPVLVERFEEEPLTPGVRFSVRERNGEIDIYADDTQLEGRRKFPYPNQIKFLDYITETPNYRSGVYEFVIPVYITSPDDPAINVYGLAPFLDLSSERWTLSDYLDEKNK
jgi:hypothetical protein